MKNLLFFFIFLLFASPLLYSEETVPTINQEEVMAQAQELISSRVFLQEFGARKLMPVTANLTKESKEMLYYRNRRLGGLSLLNIAIPSLGSFLAGDPAGAIYSLLGTAAGIGVFMLGFPETVTPAPGSPAYDPANQAPNISDSVVFSMAAGVVIVTLTHVFTIVRANRLATEYNQKLYDGIGLVSYDNGSFNRIKEQFVYNTQTRKPDLIHFNLAVFRF